MASNVSTQTNPALLKRTYNGKDRTPKDAKAAGQKQALKRI